jgi:hypothetical protein
LDFGSSRKCTNTTFGNLKGVDIFKVVEEAIKQMERLQNLNMEMIEMTWIIEVQMKSMC